MLPFVASANRLPTGSLVIRLGPTGTPYYEGKWRHESRQRLRRIGPAWVEPDGAGGWRRRKGRVPDDHFDEKQATVRMAELIREDAERAAADTDDERARRERPPTFREVMVEWLEWLEQVKGARQSTLRGYRSLLAEPGTSHRRGKGTTRGLILAEFGDRPITEITTTDVSKFLRSLDAVFTSPRTVNTHRQVLSAIFNYARREDTYRLPVNPVSATDKRRELPAAALDFFEPEEIEALAQAAADGAHRKEAIGRGGKLMDLGPEEVVARAEEDAQDAELFRVLAYTGLRLGEALALQWGDIDFNGRRVIVQRAVSGNVEGPTKGWQVRYVPLADPARDALERLLAREDFTQREDYVFCNRLGGRLDGSALRRRYHAARKAAGLRHVKLHGLRHGAGSLVARHTDAVFVQHFLGHAKLATTERYMHAKARAEDIDKLNLAFGVAPKTKSES
jgi:integrase